MDPPSLSTPPADRPTFLPPDTQAVPCCCLHYQQIRFLLGVSPIWIPRNSVESGVWLHHTSVVLWGLRYFHCFLWELRLTVLSIILTSSVWIATLTLSVWIASSTLSVWIATSTSSVWVPVLRFRWFEHSTLIIQLLKLWVFEYFGFEYCSTSTQNCSTSALNVRLLQLYIFKFSTHCIHHFTLIHRGLEIFYIYFSVY